VAYSDFVAAKAALDPAYQMNAVWALNNDTLGKVLDLADSNNRPLFLSGFDMLRRASRERFSVTP
jgi:HK97 family phage major capsid protein